MKNLRNDFPIFKNNKKLIYFDNAATTQKPQQVIDAIIDYYTKYTSNVHRGIYSIAEHATTLFENARKKIAGFINAEEDEVVFTKGTTESINFVALSWGEVNISKDDEIIISQFEHHSNLIPWQQLAQRKEAVLKVIPMKSDYTLDYDAYLKLLTNKTKLVAITQESNVLGTKVDIEFIVKKANEVGAKILVDAAQSIAHQKVDVKKLGCDFLAFSGHKMLGPTGVGILYINKKMHDEMRPIYFGGGMIYSTTLEKTTFLEAPNKFEAGTPPIAQVIGLSAAVDYIENKINFDALQTHEAQLCSKVIEGLSKFEQVKILGPIAQLKQNGHLVSFTINPSTQPSPLASAGKLSSGLTDIASATAVRAAHPHDVAAYLDSYGICVRAGHHCTQPLHQSLEIESSVRVSFYAYNTLDEVEYFLEVMEKLILSKPK